MQNLCRSWSPRYVVAFVLVGGIVQVPNLDAACCYFSAKDQDILQPAQKVFITWDPMKQQETFTVQPKFEGNALDFGMVIPTPTQPKLNVMPRDFFKHLAVYSILKKREFPQSKLIYLHKKFDLDKYIRANSAQFTEEQARHKLPVPET